MFRDLRENRNIQSIILNMLINFVTEYLFDRLVVFRDSIDTNDVAERKKKNKAARTSR